MYEAILLFNNGDLLSRPEGSQLRSIAIAALIAAGSIVVVSTGMEPASAATRNQAARLQAVRACSIAAQRLIQHVWGDHEIDSYRACMARAGFRE